MILSNLSTKRENEIGMAHEEFSLKRCDIVSSFDVDLQQTIFLLLLLH